MINWIKNLWQGALLRGIRAVISLGAGILLAKYQNNEWYLAAAPLLQMAGKKLRDAYPGYWEWLPF